MSTKWKALQRRLYSTHPSGNRVINSIKYLSPLKTKIKSLKYFATLDIETVEYKGEQIPLLLSIHYNDNNDVAKTIVLNKDGLENGTALKNFWYNFVRFVSEEARSKKKYYKLSLFII